MLLPHVSALILLASFSVHAAGEVTNGSFELDAAGTQLSLGSIAAPEVFQGWRLFSAGTEETGGFSPISASITDDAAEGKQAARLEVTTVGVSYNYGLDTFAHRLPVVHGTTYVCTFSAAAPEKPLAVTFAFVEYDSEGGLVNQKNFVFEVTDKKYAEFTAEWTPTSHDTKDVNLMFQPTSNPDETSVVHLDNIRFYAE